MSEPIAPLGDTSVAEPTPATTVDPGSQTLDIEPVHPPAEPTQDDFKAQFQSNPEFAWQQYNELRGKYGDANNRAKTADPLLQLAQWAGNGDANAGVPLLNQLVQNYANVASNPQMKRILDHYQATGKVPDSYLDLDAEPADPDGLDPAASQRFVELDQRAQRLEGRLVQRDITDHLDTFFRTDDIGRHLVPEERAEVLRELHATIQRASQNPAQRGVIDNLNLDTVANIATAWVRKEGKFAEISDRMQRARAETRQAAATERPSGLSTSGVPTIPDYGKDHKSAIEQYAREAGVNLWEPTVR